MEEQKPVAWMLEYKMDGETEFESNKINEFSCGRTGGVPLYTHPAPDVVKQLVEALVNSEDLITGYLQTFAKRGEKMPYGHRVLGEVQLALAKAKEAGL